MKQFAVFLLFLFESFIAVAQINVCGTVVDGESNEPLVAATIVAKGEDGKIKAFATSKADGTFAMQVPSAEGCNLEVSMLGFAKQTMPLEGMSFPFIFYMKPGAVLLKEVAVKGDRIREQGDTVTYYVATFKQAQDRSIGDVLKRMPGINVSKNGKIQYQGEDINKFYIEGSDLLGGKYGIATNGISHEDIGAVEVLENHQPMQVLSGISFSSKAAINLKLKDKSKATWSIHGDAGGGLSWQPEGAVWDGELFAMAAMPTFQSMTTLCSNNTGEDLALLNTDFFANRRGTELDYYINIGMPDVPSLNSNRTLFNRSALASSNSLWKLRCGEAKFNMDYLYNQVSADASNITTYFLDGGNRIITENRNGTEREHSLSGKLVYELNRKAAFVNNTLQANASWDNIVLRTTGSLPNTQSADLQNLHVSNNFKMIRRFKGKHLVTFNSCNEWGTLPQVLNIETDDAHYSQTVDDHALFTHESAAYAFTLNGVTVGLEGGLKGYARSMNSVLPNVPEELPGITENVVHTNSFTVYTTPKLEYWIRKVDIALNLPVSYAHYTFDKAIANRDEMYFAPSLNLIWKPNSRFSSGLRGGLGRSPMNLNLIHPRLVMNNYRTLKSGVDDFYNSSSQNISANFSYKQTRYGLFANGLVMHSWSHVPYTMAQQLYGDYVVYSYADADNDSEILMAIASIGKTLDFMNGSCNLNGSFNRNSSRLLSQQQSVQSVSVGWSIGGKVNGSPCRWLGFDYVIEYYNNRIAMNELSAPWLSAMTNEIYLNFIPHKKWQWQMSGEHFHNELSDGQFKDMLMLDTKLMYQPTKRIELSMSLTNILNKRQYNYTAYSQLSSFESQRMLRGRQLLISVALRK